MKQLTTHEQKEVEMLLKSNMRYSFQLTSKDGFCISLSDIKIFSPIKRVQFLTVDNKHDFLKVIKRCRKLKNASILKMKSLNRAESLKLYKSMYKGYSIKQLQNIGLTI